MTEAYLLIKCGYEGIEGLEFLHEDSKVVVDKINSIRAVIHSAIQKKAEILKENSIVDEGEEYEKVWGILNKLHDENRITHEEFSAMEGWDEPDQYCIMKWNGESFNCVCPELGVEPSKTWLM